MKAEFRKKMFNLLYEKQLLSLVGNKEGTPDKIAEVTKEIDLLRKECRKSIIEERLIEENDKYKRR